MKNTLNRKQREMKEREQRILEVACRLLLEDGYLGLTMSRIARAIEYSKGTIYQHFSCKEEIMAELALKTGHIRRSLFERGAMFRGRPRERMSALGEANEVFQRLYPQHLRAEQLIRSSSIKDKVSEERRRRLESCEQGCMSVCGGVVRDAVVQGDLALADPAEGHNLVLGLWSMGFGTFLLAHTDLDMVALGFDADLFGILRRNCHKLMDGYGWRPLSTELEYEAIHQRVRREIFAEEWKRFGRGEWTVP